MPKAARRKWYAVRKGWDGPRIYNTWEETQKGVWRYPGAVFKSFRSQSAAEEWLQIGIEAMGDNTPLVNHASSVNTPLLPRANSIPMIMDADPSTEPEKTFSSPPGNDSTSPGASGSNMDVSEDASEEVPLEPLEPAVKLSPEQEHVFNLVKSGKSVFFTGSAGTGKSVLLRAIIRWCQKEHKNYAVTASTGIASVNIGGTTLHSWAGIGQGKETAEKLVGKIIGHDKWLAMKERQKRIEQGLSPDDPGSFIDDKSSPRTLKRWRMCDVLILDEISMIDGKLFDKLEFMARALRQNPKPFGGIQLVLSGDFCQLPPVPDKEKNVVIPATFAFDAKSWNACVGKPIALTKVFRQKDQHFVDMLNAMRFGNLNQHYIQAFRGLNRKVEYADGLEPTDLFPTRHEVDNANSHRLNAIQAEPHQYEARDTPGYDSNGNLISKDQMNRLLDRLVAPQSITLKVGAQVMLIKNIVQGVLVNGSLGRVIDFLTTREASAQGLKLSIIDNEKERVWQGEEEARRRGFQRHKRIPNELLNSSVKWPVVQFATSLGGSMELPMCCIPCSFDVNNAEGRIEAMREQVPLILAWALSIHKSQGQTLQRVRVDLSRIFEKGQAYVALSRATNMDTLEVRGFDPMKVQAHPRVITWTRENTETHIPYGASQSGYDSSDEAEYWDHV